MKKKGWINLIVLSLTVVLSLSFVYAFFFQKETKDTERTFGEVFVVTPIYFEGDIDPVEVSTVSTYTKKGVYEVNISEFNDYHINNLRIDFQINSNIDTYFRVKIIDSLTIVYKNAAGKTIELVLPVVDLIEYEIDEEKWFYDKTSDWFYYKSSVNLEDDIISFITEGVSYPLQIQQFKIQLGLIVEAVQAYRGPAENWKIDKKPWDGEDW